MKNIQFDVTDSHIIDTIDKTLISGDINKQSFALDLIKNMKIEIWRDTLNKLLSLKNKDIQKQIMLLALEKGNFLDNNILIKLSKQDDEIGALAITLLPGIFIKNNFPETFNIISFIYKIIKNISLQPDMRYFADAVCVQNIRLCVKFML